MQNGGKRGKYENIIITNHTAKKNLLLFSTSKMRSSKYYLGYGLPSINSFLSNKNIDTITCITFPYASDKEERSMYHTNIKPAFKSIGFNVTQISKNEDIKSMIKKINDAQAIYVCGGNTYNLVKILQQNNLMKLLRDKILSGTPYIGASAGTNIVCPTLKTSNDLPVVWPESAKTLNLIPFQINVHYDESYICGGESREDKIERYLTEHPKKKVLGLEDGTFIYVSDNYAELLGLNTRQAILMQNKGGRFVKEYINVESVISDLL